MTPTLGFPGATAGARRGVVPGAAAAVSILTVILSRSRMGFWWPVRICRCSSLKLHSLPTVSSSFIMTAKGLAGRCFLVRSFCTASSLVASQHR